MKTLIDSHLSGKFKNDYAPNGVSDLKCFHMEGELYCGLSLFLFFNDFYFSCSKHSGFDNFCFSIFILT